MSEPELLECLEKNYSARKRRLVDAVQDGARRTDRPLQFGDETCAICKLKEHGGGLVVYELRNGQELLVGHPPVCGLSGLLDCSPGIYPQLRSMSGSRSFDPVCKSGGVAPSAPGGNRQIDTISEGQVFCGLTSLLPCHLGQSPRFRMKYAKLEAFIRRSRWHHTAVGAGRRH